jgi:hypothetical protein
MVASAGCPTRTTLRQQPVASDFHHRAVDVGQNHFAGVADQRRIQRSEVAGTASKIEDVVARAHSRHLDHDALHDPVRTERHQIVHDVVALRHRFEHATHPARLFRRRYLLKTKIDAVFFVRLHGTQPLSGCQ